MIFIERGNSVVKKPISLRLLWELFLTFAKIGMFTFGGGYAMISIIENTCVERKQWITHDEMMTITVIAESTPGPMAINCATYVGLKQAGIPGSLAATVGIVLPSFVILYLIASVLDNFLAIPLIANAFRGIKIGVGLLILRVALNMVGKMPSKPFPRTVAAAAFAAVLASNFFSLGLRSISLMVIAALVSLCVFAAKKKKGGDSQ